MNAHYALIRYVKSKHLQLSHCIIFDENANPLLSLHKLKYESSYFDRPKLNQ